MQPSFCADVQHTPIELYDLARDQRVLTTLREHSTVAYQAGGLVSHIFGVSIAVKDALSDNVQKYQHRRRLVAFMTRVHTIALRVWIVQWITYD
jgi:hypothetical protein